MTNTEPLTGNGRKLYQHLQATIERGGMTETDFKRTLVANFGNVTTERLFLSKLFEKSATVQTADEIVSQPWFYSVLHDYLLLRDAA